MKELTKRQEEVLNFIKKKLINPGYPPTINEIAREFNIQNINAAVGHLIALEKKGFIRREKYKSRALIILQPGK